MEIVLINGPCGVGKSTTSRELWERKPAAELIQLDSIRKSVSEKNFLVNGKINDVARMWQANVVGRRIARKAVTEARPVIIDSIKYQEEWIKPWEDLGYEFDLPVYEICLIAPINVVMERAVSRGFKPGGRLTPQKVVDRYERVMRFYRNRPSSYILENTVISPAECSEKILELIDRTII